MAMKLKFISIINQLKYLASASKFVEIIWEQVKLMSIESLSNGVVFKRIKLEDRKEPVIGFQHPRSYE